MIIDINDMAKYGVISDQSPHMLPPEAWSVGDNVRFRDGSVECLLGWEQIFGTPLIPPHFAMTFRTTSLTYWLYTSLDSAAVYDGSAHTNITRTSALYATNETRQWNGIVFGGIPILNNESDVPQYWPGPPITNKLADLTNWTATHRAKVIRSLGPYLVALNITKSGTNYPHLAKWSNPADPGTLPTSWDHTNPNNDAGENDLSDVQSGIILDALALQSTLFIYKEGAIHRMNIIGGRKVMDFQTFNEGVGLLAPRCVAMTSDGMRHVFAAQDDLMIHNGNNVDSILTRRQKQRLFAEIDTQYYINSFMYSDPTFNEIWFCYPTSGNIQPNKALIWNYREGEQGVVSFGLDINYRNVVIGNLELSTDEVWDTGTDLWLDDNGPWSEIQRRKLIALNPTANKFYNLNKGYTRDGVVFSKTLQRTGLSILGRRRNGEWIVDFQKMKMAMRLWPKVIGGPVRVRFGAQQLIGGEVTWSPYVTFTPGVDRVIDPGIVSGASLAVEFSSVDTSQWRVDGYKYELEELGEY